MVWTRPVDGRLSSGQAQADQVGGGLDAIRNHGVFGRTKSLHSMDSDRRRSGALHLSPHGVQKLGQVGNFGLARRVVDDRRPFGQHGRHEQILGSADAGKLQQHLRSKESLHPALDVAVAGREGDPHLLESSQVHVDGPMAEVVAAGDRHPGLAEPSQQRAQNHDGGPHALHQVVGRLGGHLLGNVNREDVALLGRGRTHPFQEFTHPPDVGDPGHVAQRVPPGPQE